MKKWAFAITAAFFAVASVAAGAVALTDGDSSKPAAPLTRDADSRGESGGDGSTADCDTPPCEDVGGGAAGICIEGTVDCNDTPTEKPPEGDACILIFPTPLECTDPDAPVTNEPPAAEPGEPGTIGPGDACTLQYPNECSGKAAAIADLAARLDVNEDSITVVSAERVDWPDACLGVSQPDVACAEMITAGYRIILEANGQTYEYHTDGGSRAVLVE
jgi:hypothetical protein